MSARRDVVHRPSRDEAARSEYVFGYGSLVECTDRVGMLYLTGYRRSWNVAMDNRVDLPGYKYYVDPVTGARPDVAVTFLSVSPAGGGRVNGALMELAPGDLDRLDRRERNYVRVEVSAALSAAVPGTVWAYVGTTAARERFAAGRRSGRAVVQAEYYERVRREFAGVDGRGLAEFDRLTPAPACPVVDLRRVDL